MSSPTSEPTSQSISSKKSTDKIRHPIIHEPLFHPHTHTLILLHGRGSNAQFFSDALLKTPVGTSADPTSLRQAFPHAKFVFPTAAWSRATVWGRTLITQWFDNWSLEAPHERQELQIDGLRKTTNFLHGLIWEEARVLGDARNVVLGGLSQGGAATLVAGLLWDVDGTQRLGAVFGMCAWLPFRKLIDDVVDSRRGEDTGEADDDLFDADDDVESEKSTAASRAVVSLSEMLELGLATTTSASVNEAFDGPPVFLAHGVDDPKVKVHLGREARNCLKGIGAHVSWREYSELGHWYSSEMLGDVVEFLKDAMDSN
ncbi:MAG: hypothetical protein M1831_000288 [Alyxoria varia]|nr:MAG: hypothetical protein M1831_000288 [Alyxoria varia]